MKTAAVEPPVPREQLNMEPFTADERIRLVKVMLDEVMRELGEERREQ
jgi:hypothetical protein